MIRSSSGHHDLVLPYLIWYYHLSSSQLFHCSAHHDQVTMIWYYHTSSGTTICHLLNCSIVHQFSSHLQLSLVWSSVDDQCCSSVHLQVSSHQHQLMIMHLQVSGIQHPSVLFSILQQETSRKKPLRNLKEETIKEETIKETFFLYIFLSL